MAEVYTLASLTVNLCVGGDGTVDIRSFHVEGGDVIDGKEE